MNTDPCKRLKAKNGLFQPIPGRIKVLSDGEAEVQLWNMADLAPGLPQDQRSQHSPTEEK